MTAKRRWTLRLVTVGLATALGFVTVSTALASPEGQAAADQCTDATYRFFLGDSLGVDGILYTHAGDDRGVGGAEHNLCRDNIASEFESYGLTVTLEPVYYSGTYYNVVGTKLGTLYPDQEYIVGAHYDSASDFPPAPGADDDASGVALVLECARIISQYDSDYTIRFVAFTREEQGLYGSEAYVDDHAGDDILAMVQADMVAYDTGTDHAFVYGHDAPALPLKNALRQAISDYSSFAGSSLTSTDEGWISASDHASFDAAGYQACLLIESLVWSNPYYHTQQDSVDNPNNINYAYAVRMTRSVVGYLVDAAGVQVSVDKLAFDYPNGQPEFVSPAGGTTMRVSVSGLGSAVPDPGTGVLHYDIGGGWQAQLMDVVSANVYDAVFPAAPCGTEVQYYVSAEEVSTEVFTDPWDAPLSFYAAVSAYGEDVALADDFETDQGWVAENLGASSGDWQRGVPVNDPGWDYDPASDSDGSGRCYLTQNQTGNTDVDSGSVRLTSPAIDMSVGDVTISYDYYLYLTDSDGTDRLLVEINNNGGVGTWIEIARHDTSGGLSWRSQTIDQDDLDTAGVTLTANMKVRFTANDGDSQSIVEAGLDAFQVASLTCTAAGCPNPGVTGHYCATDVYPNNGDGSWDYADDGDCIIDLSDLGELLPNYGTTSGLTREDGDVYPVGAPDGAVDMSDLGELLAQYGDNCN